LLTATVKSAGLSAAPHTGQWLFVARSASLTDLSILIWYTTEPHLPQTTSADSTLAASNNWNKKSVLDSF
jgi:hypothetical protein